MTKTGDTNDQTMTDLFNDLREQRDREHERFSDSWDIPIHHSHDFDLREPYTIDGFGYHKVSLANSHYLPEKPVFGITREDAYTLDRFSSRGDRAAKPGEFPHQETINRISGGTPWENIIFCLSAAPISAIVSYQQDHLITTLEAFVYSFLVILIPILIFVFRYQAYNYSRRFFPEKIHVGHSTTLHTVMERIRDVAVNDTDTLWGQYEDITRLIVDYNEYRLNNHEYWSEVNQDNRDKEVMVLVSKIQEIDEIITDREQTVKEFAGPNMELPISEDIYRAEFLNSVILDRGLVPESVETMRTHSTVKDDDDNQGECTSCSV